MTLDADEVELPLGDDRFQGDIALDLEAQGLLGQFVVVVANGAQPLAQPGQRPTYLRLVYAFGPPDHVELIHVVAIHAEDLQPDIGRDRARHHADAPTPDEAVDLAAERGRHVRGAQKLQHT